MDIDSGIEHGPPNPGRAHAKLRSRLLLSTVFALSWFIWSPKFGRQMLPRTPQYLCSSVFISGFILILVNPWLKPQIIHFDIAQHVDLTG